MGEAGRMGRPGRDSIGRTMGASGTSTVESDEVGYLSVANVPTNSGGQVERSYAAATRGSPRKTSSRCHAM